MDHTFFRTIKTHKQRKITQAKIIKPEAIVTYKNPPTLNKNLQNYKQLAFQINDHRPGFFFLWKLCTL